MHTDRGKVNGPSVPWTWSELHAMWMDGRLIDGVWVECKMAIFGTDAAAIKCVALAGHGAIDWS